MTLNGVTLGEAAAGSLIWELEPAGSLDDYCAALTDAAAFGAAVTVEASEPNWVPFSAGRAC